MILNFREKHIAINEEEITSPLCGNKTKYTPHICGNKSVYLPQN